MNIRQLDRDKYYELKIRPPTPEEILRAESYWRNGRYHFKDEDNHLQPFIALKIDQKTNWLQSARRSLQLSTNQVAKKANISSAAYSKFEKNELSGKITIESLKKMADAMDCELIYCVRPKNNKSFSQIIWATAIKQALLHPFLKVCDPYKKANALAKIVDDLIHNPKFRRKNNWSLRN